MAKRGKFKSIKVVDNGEYVSRSTVDNPPAINDDGQAEIPGVESPKEVRQGRQVKFKLQLKADDYVLPVAGGEVPADMVEECLVKGLAAERFRSVLREVVGQPLNAGLIECDSSAQRELLQESVANTYRRTVETIIRAIPKSTAEVGPAELKAIFKDMKRYAADGVALAQSLLAGGPLPKMLGTPERAVEARSPAEPTSGAGMDENF